VNERTMKKAPKRRAVDPDDILPEYDFSRAAANPYASKYAAGSSVVVLEPDVAAAFPNAKAANDALRTLAEIIQKHTPNRPISRHTR
jgi:hypothetical protein